MILGEKLKTLRKQAGLSQEQLAEKLSLSRATIAKWEGDFGVPDIRNLRALSQLLGVPLQALLDDAPIPSQDRQFAHGTSGTSTRTVRPSSKPKRPIPVRPLLTPLRKQRLLFLLAAYLLLSFSLMLMPISVAQVGLPDLTELPVTAIAAGGNRPSVSTRDPALQEADPAVIAACLSRMQAAMEDASFYCRTMPLNPLRLMSVNGTWLLIETDTDSYWFGDYHGLFFVEINGARRYYKAPDKAVTKEIHWLQDYFVDLERTYYASLPPS